MRSLLLIGGTSDIGTAIARRFAREGRPVVLAARDVGEAEAAAADLRHRFGVPARAVALDVRDLEAGLELVHGLEPCPEIAVAAVGWLPEQAAVREDPEGVRRVVEVNFTAPALLLAALGRRMAEEGVRGHLVALGSVAGDRGRASNWWYGAAKAGLHAAMEGLRQELLDAGVRVLTVRPGFVRTKMTAHLVLPPFLTSTPEDVARLVHRAVTKGRSGPLYPFPWRPVSLLVRLLPASLARRI